MSIVKTIVLGLGAAFALIACGGDARETATAVIESEIEDQVGLGELTASCQEPEERVVGSEFPCTATTESGDLIKITTTFEEEDRIFVLPTNVVLASDMELVEAAAAKTIGDEVGAEIDPSDVDCPDTSVVLDADDQMRCEITDTSVGTTYELIVTLTDFVRDEGFQRSFFQVGDVIE